LHAPSPLFGRLRNALAHLPGRGLLQAIGAYTAHPDPRVEIAGKIAGIIVGNQPFYPLYLLAIVGTPGWIGCWTWLTTPFFAAVPAVARRNATAGRVLMCCTGMANTVLCEKLLGTASGVGWFALPCTLLAFVTFHAREWRIAAPLTLLCAGGGLLAGTLMGPPVLALDPAALASLTKLHLVSVASLVLVIGYFRIRHAGES
jgi:hypothetical protein